MYPNTEPTTDHLTSYLVTGQNWQPPEEEPMEQNDFAALLDQYTVPRPQQGDILKGHILRIENDVIFIDVGSKRDAMVPHEEVKRLDENYLQSLARGDEVLVYVTSTPAGDNPLLVSLEQGLQALDWERAAKLQTEGTIHAYEVLNYNKGGIIVKFGYLQGFVPNSHLPDVKEVHDVRERTRRKAKLVSTEMPLTVIEVDADHQRLVLSATEAEREQKRLRLQHLNPGDVVKGTVVHLKDYGAFVDIGQGLTGLLHVSKIAHEHVNHPQDVLHIGDEIEVVIEEVSVSRERISLNRQATLADPWQSFAAAHQVGDLMEGQVTSLVEYGAFIRVEGGIEGLLHISEIQLPSDTPLEALLQPDDNILVRIIEISPEQQRLSLSMKRISAAEEINWLSTHHQQAADPEQPLLTTEEPAA